MVWMWMLLGCPEPEVIEPPPFGLTSAAFAEGDFIPEQFTCDGADLSPPLAWEGVPETSAELVLVVDDPDAPLNTFVHWLAWGLPASGIAEDATGGDFLEGSNGFGVTGWRGPCPPEGAPHTYVFTLSAVDVATGLEAGATRADVDAALAEHVIEAVQLTGEYKRGGPPVEDSGAAE